MKKISLKNIIIISVLTAALFSGNFEYSVYCEAEGCCKTDYCEGNSNSINSDLLLSFNNSDCCEYKAFENEIHATTSLSSNNKINTTTPSILHQHIPDRYESNYKMKESSFNHIPVNHSISILRI